MREFEDRRLRARERQLDARLVERARAEHDAPHRRCDALERPDALLGIVRRRGRWRRSARPLRHTAAANNSGLRSSTTRDDTLRERDDVAVGIGHRELAHPVELRLERHDHLRLRRDLR